MSEDTPDGPGPAGQARDLEGRGAIPSGAIPGGACPNWRASIVRRPLVPLDEKAAANSQLARFQRDLQSHFGLRLDDWPSLHRWSVEHDREFWAFFVQWSRDDLGLDGELQPVREGDSCEHARFFPGLRLNYADSVLNLRVADANAPALVECHADGSRRRWSRGALRDRVAGLALGLVREGIRPGDRVAGVMRNDGAAVAAALAVAAVGATLSTASPDMGPEAILERFGPLAPRLLLAHTAALPLDAGQAVRSRVEEVASALPTLEAVVVLDHGGLALPRSPGVRVLPLDELCGDPGGQEAAASFDWPRFAFDHPLFAMFSSGTTGKPKRLLHGTGGTLIEHVKEHRLHTDLRCGDRLFFHTGCGWMMWNWQLSALACGAEIVTWDGGIPTVDALWRLVADERVTVFGTSPGYLKMCADAGLEPGRDRDLGALRAVLSTGAILYDSQFRWVVEHAKTVPVQSISGGTDIIGCFVLGNPLLPVYAGEAQCRSLGLDVQAWDTGASVPGIGELVCCNPFPSRPLGFDGDTDGQRFHAAYFARNPGIWTHGDLVEFTPEGTARLHGRCDGVLNVRGIKFAPAEVCRVLDEMPGVRESMVVEQRLATLTGPAAGEPCAQGIVALLVMHEGATLDAALLARMRREVAARLSPAHVPDRLIDVPALPMTHSGKLSEAAARQAVSGLPIPNAGALRDPAVLDAIRAHPGLQTAVPAQGTATLAGAPLIEQLRHVWERLLGVATVADDDDFFELGGSSLLAARLMREVREVTGRDLPLAAVLHARTLAGLATLVAGGGSAGTTSAVRIRRGQGDPLFLVHGLSGTVMECLPLVNSLRTARPVVALQAPGLDGEAPPLDRVQAMAAVYLQAIRKVQPHGPYALCGFSFGGLVAFELARMLHEQGEVASPLVLLEPYMRQDLSMPERMRQRLVRAAGKWRRMSREQIVRWAGDCMRRLARSMALAAGLARPRSPGEVLGLAGPQARVYDAMLDAVAAYRPEPYEGGPVILVRAQIPLDGYDDPLPVWRRVAARGLQVVSMPDGHLDLVAGQARRVAAVLDAAMAPSGPLPWRGSLRKEPAAIATGKALGA